MASLSGDGGQFAECLEAANFALSRLQKSQIQNVSLIKLILFACKSNLLAPPTFTEVERVVTRERKFLLVSTFLHLVIN